KVAQDQEVMYW
ncbi:unnamed protein product, partial [Allacma fusca]